jgi:hypothetical protein
MTPHFIKVRLFSFAAELIGFPPLRQILYRGGHRGQEAWWMSAFTRVSHKPTRDFSRIRWISIGFGVVEFVGARHAVPTVDRLTSIFVNIAAVEFEMCALSPGEERVNDTCDLDVVRATEAGTACRGPASEPPR